MSNPNDSYCEHLLGALNGIRLDLKRLKDVNDFRSGKVVVNLDFIEIQDIFK